MTWIFTHEVGDVVCNNCMALIKSGSEKCKDSHHFCSVRCRNQYAAKGGYRVQSCEKAAEVPVKQLTLEEALKNSGGTIEELVLSGIPECDIRSMWRTAAGDPFAFGVLISRAVMEM